MLEPRRWRLQRTEIVSMHSSLGNTVRLCLKKEKRKKKREGEGIDSEKFSTLSGIDQSTSRSYDLSVLRERCRDGVLMGQENLYQFYSLIDSDYS